MFGQIDKPRPDQSNHSSPAVVERLKDPGWAWSAYKPNASRPWNLARAGHLYRRAAFGTDWGQLQQAVADGPDQAIDKLLRPDGETAAFDREYDEYEGSAGSADELRAWWLRRMIQTPHPLQEKMTLFWHGHFAVNAAEVKDARLMREHLRLLRDHSLGSFRSITEGICRDPAMLIGLGAEANRKALPNENFARALLGVFTVGPGGCTEKDVRETARAFTGWFVLRGKLRYIAREHDGGLKQILGQKGQFTGDDVVRIVLAQPAAAHTVARKLYRFFISETQEPENRLIAPLADSLAKDYDMLKLVERILRSNLFFSAAAYRRRVKCPVEFALGIVRGLEGVVSTTQLAQDTAELGRNLYHPPTAEGWAGGRHWINTAAMARRHNLALALLGGSKPYGKKLNPWTLAQRHGASTPESAMDFLLDLFLQDHIDSGVSRTMRQAARTPNGAGGNSETMLRRFAHMVVTLPEFHLA